MKNKTELLAPAGSFSIAKRALYSGADAIYLATERFGARAYAKNLSLEELEALLPIAHTLHKKIYVTVNTLIKDSELMEVYHYLDLLYQMGVDALIVADPAVFMYVIANCKGMECHLSTQVGVKDIEDALFFQELGAERVVLARENSFEEIEKIRKMTDIQLEVFIHGALCVSYSGGCLMSSLLSLRSGNRGRCSQNCRREYTLFEDGKKISSKGYYLSMKDLYAGNNVTKLQSIGVDSLKIEGRMKNETYVSVITRYYKGLLAHQEVSDKEVNQIFHRHFTKGFLFGEDRGSIVTPQSPSSEGRKIGKVLQKNGNTVKLIAYDTISYGDRLRFAGEVDQYFTINNMKTAEGKSITSGKGEIILQLDFSLINQGTIYKMVDKALNEEEISNQIIPITAYLKALKNTPLELTVVFENAYYTVMGDRPLEEALNKPTTKEMFYQQLSKLRETPFYLEAFECNMDSDIYVSVSEINEIRRKMIQKIYEATSVKREMPVRKELFLKRRIQRTSQEIIVFATTQEQYDEAKRMGIDTVFFKNYSPYVGATYNEIEEDSVLVSNYGGLRHYINKDLTTDYSFNVLNSEALLHLLNLGAAHVTLSYELSFAEIKELSTSFLNKYGASAPIDLIIYGHQNLMTTKYCPLKQFHMCGKCDSHQYELKDEIGSFLITHQKGCITHILNGQTLNLIPEIKALSPYVDRFRLQFTTESKEEVRKVIEMAQKALNGDTSFHLEKNQTRGYFKRPIL